MTYVPTQELFEWLVALVCVVVLANGMLALALYHACWQLRDIDRAVRAHNDQYHPDADTGIEQEVAA